MFDGKMWVDPPSGWKYGFPKMYDPEIANTKDLYEWIIENGYPRKIAESYGNYFNYRMWQVDESVTSSVSEYNV